ncbi:MAG: PfaB family protein [Psychromonas sp.]
MVLQVIDTKLAVIGFNAIFNGLNNIDEVEASLYRGLPLSSTERLSDSETELIEKCVIPVLQANNLRAQQVALLVVNDAVKTNISDGYLSQQSVSHLGEALHCAELMIKSENIAVLIVSASLPTQINNVSHATISFDESFRDYARLQGAACLLLTSESFVTQHNSVRYATINHISRGEQSEIDDIIDSALNAPASVGRAINALEVSACVNAPLNLLEQQALMKSYGRINGQKTLTTAISCQKSVLGDNGVLSQLMSLIHSVISLQQRYRPAIKDWSAPQSGLLTQWLGSPFYLFNEAAPVFPCASGQVRLNGLSLLSEHHYSHVILSANADISVHQNGFSNHLKQSLFIVGADNEQGLLTNLKQLHVAADLKALALTLYEEYQQHHFVYNVILIADSVDELNKEIELSLKGIQLAFLKQSDWKTPKGSFFTCQPDKSAKSAFLYPGIGATYVGLGRDLFHLFPEIYPAVIALADNIGASLKDELLNPRSVVALDFKTLKNLDLQLRNSLANIAECGVGYACVFTKIFELVFNIKADFASGYSMGEISMFAALGCWQTPGLMSARLANSDTFNHQLSSELRAIRTLWNLPDIKDGEFEQIWETYSIKGTLSEVEKEIQRGERVYVTIINTPDSLVIAGFPADCLAVIKRLGVRVMPLNMANAIHSAPAYQEYDNMLVLYNMPVTARIPTKMISSSCYLPIPQHQKAIAMSIAKCLCEPVDFPRLVNTLADKGCQIFIEMGAGRSLCSWTDKILKTHDENHITVAVNAKGTDNQLTYARAVAKLISFGVDINIERFFKGSILQQVVLTPVLQQTK